MKPKLNIVKIGGNIIENQADLGKFLELFSDLPGQKILVHGGGKMASGMERKLGIESKYANGRRITAKDSLDVVVMVYGGLVNKNIVAKLQALDCNAIGLSGADAGTILAHKRPVKEIDFGYVGDIDQVNGTVINTFLQAGICPVFCALTHDGEGQLFNTNADTIASELAIGLSEEYDTTIYYCFEKNGVLYDIEDEDSVIRQIDEKYYQELLAKNIISDGMLPKLHNCFHALKSNVDQIKIGNMNMLESDAESYTTIRL